jgi:hypothetical protein
MRVEGKLPSEVELALRRVSALPSEPGGHDWWIVQGLAIVESCIDSLLASELDDEIQKLSELGRFLANGSRALEIDTWPSRLQLMQKALGLYIRPDRVAQDFRLVIEIRNALVHGNGCLTARQVSEYSKVIELRRNASRKLRIAIVGTRVDTSELSWIGFCSILYNFLLAFAEGLYARRALVCK